MPDYRWTDILKDITSAERKYNIRNPRWNDGWRGVFKDYGFVPVDSKGDWWTRIPNAPELPIIYAPVANTSYTIPTGIGTTTTTGLIDTVNVIGDATFTELPSGETVATVTTGGVVSATSSAVATGAVGAAIGFAVGVGVFESAPEFCTKVSNAVFGTDLDPAEIGQMARDTNALVVIKDGIVYMAEDMVNAIRNAFFDNGAAGAEVAPSYPSGETNIELTTAGGGLATAISLVGASSFLAEHLQYMNEQSLEIYNEFLSNPNVFASAQFYPAEDPTSSLLQITGVIPKFELPHTVVVNLESNSGLYIALVNSEISYNLYIYGTGTATCSKSLNTSNNVIRFGTSTTSTPSGTIYWAGSANAASVYIDGITPTGEQGTKDQPIATLFPSWLSRGIETVAGDGVTKVKWLPVSLPKDNPLVSGNPLTTDKAQDGTLPDNYTETASQLGEQAKEQTKNAPSYPTPPITPVPDITPTPSDPSIAGGGGSATGLANIYNPTLAQVKEFSRWLWGSDGLNLDQLKKLLQDPMQAIIGLHVMYATPTTGAERGIQVGYINSGVNSKIVTEQYTEIDCGTVTINEYFGDARDYSPFTQVYCYLPFIGIVELNADDVVNSTLGIKYKIDVLTGCCLAQLTVKKYGLDAVLYTYTGNCAVQMPITSGNYLSTVSSLLGAVVSGAAAVATGGALAPVAIGAAANALGGGARASVAMSGSLGSNSGAMGIRKPYLIIKRVEQADANGYNEFYGYPTNRRVNLSQLSGYVRVKDINLSGTTATEEEQNEIVALLREGVLL